MNAIDKARPYVLDNPSISNKELASLVGCHEKTASRVKSELLKGVKPHLHNDVAKGRELLSRKWV